ncbi:MAG TPA: DUF2958 domain-containing protein [Candidatus Limnocylindrales bacterium]|nr:DUF2958 domain-containing protein [Candidatus Limnocylindrales bacterium]
MPDKNNYEKGGENMELLTVELKEKLPALYAQEKERDPLVYIKFFDPTGSWTWYATEGEEADDDFLFFGYVVGHDSELGYFTLSQLRSAKKGVSGILSLPIERDLYFKPCRLSEVKGLNQSMCKF